MRLYLSNILENDPTLSLQELSSWFSFDKESFSNQKKLYNYQQKAIEKMIQILHLTFGNDIKDFSKLKSKYKEYGLDFDKVFKGATINRAAFWMATGSGKSIVLIKTIELLHWSIKRKLIPDYKIMLLLPREDLIAQFEKEIDEFNLNRDFSEQINLVNLKDYEENERIGSLFQGIQVYYYRSDLLRDERKETILDYKDYLNNGEWYVFLDEAHRGQDNAAEQSKMKQHVSKLTEKGFLFNFSATFTEDIDYATCAFNFNLQRFISDGYGKNIYLSESLLDFSKSKNDLMENDKQKQILKSIIVYCLIKKFRLHNTYHNPLMVTYVNSVNVEEADLKLFFNEIVKIAVGKIDNDIFEEVKIELLNELDTKPNPYYIFKKERLTITREQSDFLKNIKVDDILQLFFNANTFSKIEWQKGENGKEVLLKLISSDSYFALIRIGDVDSFIKDMLTNDYSENNTYHKENAFEKLNNIDNTINLLMGSRSFYEGWDSNRPNVINLINIGSKEAKKFIPQALGRGIRIQPDSNDFTNRKRLPHGNVNKNQLMETLFVFATDKNSINSILEEIDRSSNKAGKLVEYDLGNLFEKNETEFTLLIPIYKEKKIKVYSKFSISQESLKRLLNFINDTSKTNILLNYELSISEYDKLINLTKTKDLFQIDEKMDYKDTRMLLVTVIEHLKNYEKEVEKLKELEHEISHFRHISIQIGNDVTDKDVKELKEKIIKNKNNISFDEFIKKAEYSNLSLEDQKTLYKSKYGLNPDLFLNKVNIQNFKNHLYYPLLFTDDEKLTYIKHIIRTESEVNYIKKLSMFLEKNNKNEKQWMFSKINEHFDFDLGMPYFSKETNSFRKFYPDFIFWINGKDFYDIIYIDPKGTKSTSWESKVDYFKKLFEDDLGNPKIFNYENKKVRFSLKLITDDLNKLDGNAYKKYWFKDDDFDFLLEWR